MGFFFVFAHHWHKLFFYCLIRRNPGLRSVHAQYLLAVSIDSNRSGLFPMFDEIGWINNRIGIIFLPLLHILTIFDPVIHRPLFPLMLTLGKFLLFILFYLVSQQSFHLIVILVVVVQS